MKTWDDFFDVLRASGLLSQESLDQACSATEGLTEPTIIARRLVQEKLLTRWQSRQLLAGNHTLVISNYRLLDQLDSDPASPVYLAEHTQMNRLVEVKALPRGSEETSESKEHVLGQVRALAALDHPHLCSVYDLVCEGGRYYLIAEHVSAQTARKIVATKGPFSCQVAARLISSAAAALVYAHQRGVLHLGIHPDRLAMDSQGSLKILDIGIPQLTSRHAAHSLSSVHAGFDAADYWAPEQMTGQEVDARADIYALGCVFSFLLTALPPFHAGSGLRKAAADSSLLIRAARIDVPPELADICRRMTAVRPEDRYATVGEVVQDLTAWMERAQSVSAAASVPAAPPKTPAPPAIAPSAAVRAVVNGSPPFWQKWRSSPTLYPIVGAAVVIVLLGAFSIIRLISNSTASSDSLAAAVETSTAAPTIATRATPQDTSATKPENNPPTTNNTNDLQPLSTIPPEKPAATDPPRVVAPPPTPAPAKVKPKPVAEPTQSAPSGPIKFHPLKILSITGPPGVEFRRLQDGSIMASGANPATAVYTISARTNLENIRGFRLEALADWRLPNGGPARHANGNFVINDFAVSTAAQADAPRPTPVAFVKAAASFSQENYPVAGAIDANPRTGWAILPQSGRGHWAIFSTQQPLGRPGGTWLTIKIQQLSGRAVALGRFRITLLTGDEPGEDPAAGVQVNDRALQPFSQLGKAVSLPDLPDVNDRVDGFGSTLGKVFSDPGEPFGLELLGGDSELSGKVKFAMQAAPTPEFPRRWTFQCSAAGAETVTVADLRLAGDELTFAWTPEAVRLPAANLLRNCVWNINVGTRNHILALREPLRTHGLNLGLSNPAERDTQKLDLAWLGKDTPLTIELLPTSITLPRHVLSHAYLDAGKEAVFSFAQGKNPVIFVAVKSDLHAGSRLETSLRLKTATYWSPTADAKPQPLSRPALQRSSQQGAVQQARLQAALNDLNRYNAQVPATNKPEKTLVAARIKEATRQLNETKVALKQVSGLLERAIAIDAAGPLPFRVLLKVADHQVVLVEGGGKP